MGKQKVRKMLLLYVFSPMSTIHSDDLCSAVFCDITISNNLKMLLVSKLSVGLIALACYATDP